MIELNRQHLRRLVGAAASVALLCAAALGADALAHKIKLKGPDGAQLYALKPADDGAKLLGASDEELCRLKLKGTKIKLKVGEEVVGYVTSKPGKLKLEDGEQQATHFTLRRQPDGDLKLEGGDGRLVMKLKKRPYGFEAHDAADRSLFKAKLDEGKTKVVDASGATLFYSKDGLRPEAAACLAIERLSIAQRAGLCLALQLGMGE